MKSTIEFFATRASKDAAANSPKTPARQSTTRDEMTALFATDLYGQRKFRVCSASA